MERRTAAPSSPATKAGLPDRRTGALLKGLTVKNITTPRTLADASFDVGHASAYPHERSARRADMFLIVVCVAAAGLMLWGII